MIKLTCDWRALFKYAGEAGKARVAYSNHPTEENKILMQKAINKHDEYRDLCLKADEMIGLDMSGI